MVLGNAGLVTMIATVANAMNPENTLLGWLSESYLPFLPLWSVRWFNLGIIVIAFFAIYKLSVNQKFTQKLTDYLRKKILKKDFFKPVSFEDLVMLTGGYGVTRLEVPGGKALINKTLAESGLRKNDITVLAIIRGNDTIPNPPADAIIHKSDELVLFGKLENIRDRIYEV
jgi:hypothetical protein